VRLPSSRGPPGQDHPDDDRVEEPALAARRAWTGRVGREGGEDHDHHGGSPAITRPVRITFADGGGAVAALEPLLVYPGDQEHLVVHRQPEEDREQEHGDEGVDRPAGNPEQASEPTPLEDRDNHTQRSADREQVHRRGLQRNHGRSEHDREQQAGEQDHDADE
jgi:hypothetical protein